jgi:hypothetical protein
VSASWRLYQQCDHSTARPRRADDKKIAFGTLGRGGDWEIFVMNANGSGQTGLTNNPAQDWEPAWSAHGRRIAFSRRDTTSDIWVMNADGSGQTDLTNSPSANDFEPDWSPDGSRIAFSSNPYPVGSGDIVVMNADGSGLTNLTNSPSTNDFAPVWSPDGTKIVFVSEALSAGANREIFVMNADGSAQTNLTNSSSSEDGPDWMVVLPPLPPPPPVKCVVPKVIGFRLPAARTRIRQRHCSVGRIRYASSARARGRVISQRPRGGARLPRGARVNLMVSRGRRHS